MRGFKGTIRRALSELRHLRAQRVWQSARWCLAGCAGVAIVGFSAFHLHLSFATTSFCYLLLLVLQSLSGDYLSSIIVSFLAVGSLDFFFTEPLFSFEVMSPFDLLGLASFLVTGLIITGLVTKARTKTEASRLHQIQLQKLYDLAQHLLASEPSASSQDEFLEPFLGAFGIHAACLFDATSAEVYTVGNPRPDLEERTGEAFVRNQDRDDAKRGVSVRRIRLGSRTTGAIGFEGLEDAEFTAGPLAALAAAHLERRHSFIHASRASAAVQTESYRTAILDALAHEFKTPLSTILTAAGALREAGTLDVHDREMAETVESEAARLGRLTTRLIRTARLEREEVKPWIELIDLCSALSDTIDQYSKLCTNRRILVVKECDSSEVLADPELLKLAVSQLLDNACKYSIPGGSIRLSISREDEYVVIRVLSPGNPIPASEKSKIFDRYYRGLDVRRRVPGSGLGLFVARKIALALGGSLDLDSELEPVDGVTFRLTLPAPEGARRDLATAV